MCDFINKIFALDYQDANHEVEKLCGIVDCFSSAEEKRVFLQSIELSVGCANESRISYGDWQTPYELANAVCAEHLRRYGNPDIVIEPTCGLGAFVFAALDIFGGIREIHAIEINKDYVFELKKSLISRALLLEKKSYPKIYIYEQDIFKFDFKELVNRLRRDTSKIALIGNPPWVTNSRQSQLNSHNLPPKKNIYNFRGIEAMTGKSNFDISEYISLQLIKIFQQCTGGVSLLLKNSVIRNIVYKQQDYPLSINDISQIRIDATKEFSVSVEASCFTARFNRQPSTRCNICDLYSSAIGPDYGWVGDSFVANINIYKHSRQYDGRCGYEWRSGIKHDCTPVLELSLQNGTYYNGLGEQVDIENDLLFPYLKSSDVYKYSQASGDEFKRFILVPHRHVGESSDFLQSHYPKTYYYLQSHSETFAKRKSSIYKGKNPFCVFGIGEYTFSPYKVVVSSLYKDIRFKALSPYRGKPIVVDDTCYQLAFASERDSITILNALESEEMRSLLRSIIFCDAKRVVTKNLLMRLDVDKFLQKNKLVKPVKEGRRMSAQPSLFD